MFRRALGVLALCFAVSSAATPAWACGCGAYIPDQAGANVTDERALIAWDRGTEDILMSFNVSGSSDRAAWVMPVPSAADVSLGDSEDVSPALADYVGDGAFLTRWNDDIGEPALINGDYVFEQAASDTTYQQVIYRTRDRGDITGLILLGVLGFGVVVGVVVLVRRNARRT